MNVFITGGAGFIASACANALLERGDSVVLTDIFETTLYPPHRKHANLEWLRGNHGDLPFYETDIRDRAGLDAIFAEHDIDVVLHLAAVAGVRPSIQKPALYYDINVTGTASLLEAGRAAGVSKWALASSSSVYGGNTKTPFAESDPVEHPISPYAASKRALELLARTENHLHEIDVSCLRFFTVYGPRQRPEMAIHKFMRMLDEGESIPMFGDGTTGRDYTYIDDIVDGVLRTIDNLDGYNIYNLGGDEVIQLSRLIATIGEVVGVEPKIDQLPMQPGDVFVTNADITKSTAELGYSPKTTNRAGIEKMWEWYRAEGRALVEADRSVGYDF